MLENNQFIFLEQIECCALAHAFTKNSQLVGILRECISIKTLKIFAEILINSSSLGFVPNINHALVYRNAAITEKNRLERDVDPKLNCEHRKSFHIEALQTVIEKFPISIN